MRPYGTATTALWLCLAGVTAPPAHAAPAGGALGSVLSGHYTDPRHLTLVDFGEHHSHYLQPWRAYLETIPARQFLEGIGVGMPAAGKFDANLICRMLAEHGFSCGRVEIGWGHLDYDDDTRLSDPSRLRELLAAMRRHRIRPLILLNAHQGVPCPLQFFERTVVRKAEAGAVELVMDRTGGLRPGFSGPCNLSKYWAAEALVTQVDGNTVTLSKPLPKAVEAGTRQRWATLRYRPFGKPGTDDDRRTIQGWQRYTRTVATLVADAMGTTGDDDLGFDMEVWNELTFGTEFLYINHYYEPDLVDYEERGIWDRLVEATAAELDAAPTSYAGVELVNGFSNTIPWPAASKQPSRVTGVCKHPYVGQKRYPEDEKKSKALGADGKPSPFVPAYSVHFPEYYATALQTETLCRDAAPITTSIYRTEHGRHARSADGAKPVWVWITEVNVEPSQRGIAEPAASMRLKAKAAARYFCFYLNKGVKRLFLYNATGHKGDGELDFATVSGAFSSYAGTNTGWPDDLGPYVSPQLRVTRRIADAMRSRLDPGLTRTRPVGVAGITDTHGHVQFVGDGSAQGPPLYNREVLAILPYQVNPHRFVIAYYVMTRDLVPDLPEEGYTVTFTGLRGQGARFCVRDPFTGQELDVEALVATTEEVTVVLPATDTPRLLIVQEAEGAEEP